MFRSSYPATASLALVLNTGTVTYMSAENDWGMWDAPSPEPEEDLSDYKPANPVKGRSSGSGQGALLGGFVGEIISEAALDGVVEGVSEGVSNLLDQ